MGEPAFIFFGDWWDISLFSLPQVLLVLFSWFVLWLMPLLLLGYITYFLVTIPLRRKERARLFLDLLETGFDQGQRPENFIPAISQTKEASVGARFHLLAAHLEEGLRLSQALKRVPRFLPPQVSAMLKAGEEMGDIAKVLPACRMALRDANSQAQAGFNYLILVAFVFAPVTPLIYLSIRMLILPKFKEIFYGFGVEFSSSSSANFIFENGYRLALAQLAVTIVLYFFAALYIGGPRVSGWFRKIFGDLVDLFQFLLPWRRKRMQRDFAQMLAVLLESAVPEAKAVELAGTCTGNSIFKSQSKSILSDLRNGVKLEDALGRLSQSKELHWRLKNAFHGGSFLRSLSGWFEHLDAKAFQQEQAAAHIVSTGFVISNGVLIGLIVAGIFQLLVIVINEALLW
ncbi:MAG: type II secretion system F family protein [Verrucomicrobia bacterium]|nr:type II secretion system F family protein [Verrucomicrobiota bacterium]